MNNFDAQQFALGLLAFARDDNRDATDLLATCFVELAARVEILCKQLESESEETKNSPQQIALRLQTQSIRDLVSDNVIQMQSHDMTDQRLEHCFKLLNQDTSNLSVLTDDKERKLAELLASGMDTATAIKSAKQVTTSSVELF